jgi:hypothetical protein
MDTLNDIIAGLKWGKLDPVEAHDRVLCLFNVRDQRELLISFMEFRDKIYWGENELNENEDIIDLWLKRNQ